MRAMDPAVATKMVTALQATLTDEEVRIAGHNLIMTLGHELVRVAEDILQVSMRVRIRVRVRRGPSIGGRGLRTFSRCPATGLAPKPQPQP